MRGVLLGQLLVKEGLLTEAQLESALHTQHQLYAKGQIVLLGELLIRLGYLKAEAIKPQLQLQFQQAERRFGKEVETMPDQLEAAPGGQAGYSQGKYPEWEGLRRVVAVALSHNPNLKRCAFATGYLGHSPVHRPRYLRNIPTNEAEVS